MNFFGHAVLAAAHTPEPAFVLGSMLPDLLGMSGARRVVARADRLSAGIAFHHLTDELFHEAAGFRRLARDGLAWLRSRGLHRGSAMAVAHVGTELLIDCVLGRSEPSRRAYLQSLSWSLSPGALSALEWSHQTSAERLGRVLAILVERGTKVLDPRPTAVSSRLVRALEGRPRLALRARDVPLVERWLASAIGDVEREAIPLLEELAGAFQAREIPLELTPARAMAPASDGWYEEQP